MKELNEHLREQVTTLQRRCGELLAQRRGMKYLVHEFHAKFGYPVRETPAVPPDNEVKSRLGLITEEFIELLEASLDDWAPEPWLFEQLKMDLQKYVREAPVKVDIIELADAMADLDYVVEGTRLTFGIDGWPIACEVQRSNMAKSKAQLDAADKAKYGGIPKPKKPEGWKPPNIEAELRLQGWKRPTAP